MKYQQWDKKSDVNGKTALELIGEEQMQNDDLFIIFTDDAGTFLSLESVDTLKAIYNFNKYLKKNCKLKEYYLLEGYPYDFYEANFNTDPLIYDDNGRAFLNQKDWKKIYDIEMEPIRNYLRHSQDEILQKLNQALFDEQYDANCSVS